MYISKLKKIGGSCEDAHQKVRHYTWLYNTSALLRLIGWTNNLTCQAFLETA